nr:MAG TPA: hypothetical protein [Bacteriophage sp.]
MQIQKQSSIVWVGWVRLPRQLFYDNCEFIGDLII